ncbi:MAG: fibronectin type III domain-containing protein, partial [Chloroflexota bacterium]|nr:fibronectin type III domain-containing protein [Chloroflexota bacterium]
RLPHEGENPMRIAYAHVFEEPRSLREVAPGVSAGVAAVITRAMSKDPTERFPTALDMRNELQDALSTASVAAASAGAATVAIPVIRTDNALVSVPRATTALARPAPVTRYPAATRNRGARGLLLLAPALVVTLLLGCLLLNSRFDLLGSAAMSLPTSTAIITGGPTSTSTASPPTDAATLPTQASTSTTEPESSPTSGKTPTSRPAQTASRPSAPARPAQLAGRALSRTSIELRWRRAGGPVATSYVVEYSTGRGGWERLAVLSGTRTEYVHRGLTPGETYRYRVQARNADGRSAYAAVTISTLRAPAQRTLEPTKTPTRRPTSTPTPELPADTSVVNEPRRQATSTPTPEPTNTPTPEPTNTPTPKPTNTPTPEPTNTPTPRPTNTPTPKPTNTPTPDPTSTPTPRPTSTPTPEPTNTPTPRLTNTPTPEPTNTPTPEPTSTPKPDPTNTPTPRPATPARVEPTREPNLDVVAVPTAVPTADEVAETQEGSDTEDTGNEGQEVDSSGSDSNGGDSNTGQDGDEDSEEDNGAGDQVDDE